MKGTSLSYWQFLREQWMLLLFGFLCVFWGNFGQSFFLGWYSDEIKSSLELSAQQYGAIYSLATLFSAVCMMWFGGLIDSWSLRRFMLASVLGLLLACVVLFFSHQVVLLILGFFLVRLFGQGLLPHTGLTTMARYFESNRGKALSIAVSGVSAGEIVLPLIAVCLLQYGSWQESWIWIGISTLVLLPILFGLLKYAHWTDTHLEATEEKITESDLAPIKTQSGRKILLCDRKYWLAAPTILSMPFVLTAIFIHQDYVLQQKQWTSSWMASCFILYGVVHWVSSMVFGVLVDRFSATKLLRYYNLPLIFVLFLVANVDGQWVAAVMMALLGVAIGASGPVIGALWAEVYGTKIVGGVRSTSGAIIVLSTALSPILMGWLIDHHYGVQIVFNGAAIMFAVLWFGLLGSYRRH